MTSFFLSKFVFPMQIALRGSNHDETNSIFSMCTNHEFPDGCLEQFFKSFKSTSS